jgi:hypothetical protein
MRTGAVAVRVARLLFIAASVCLTAAQADPILLPLTVYSTGVNTDGDPTNPIDLSYILVSDPDHPSMSQSPYVVDESGWPIAGGTWINYDSEARWIAPQPRYGRNSADPGGDFVYQTTFVLPDDFDPTTVLLWGSVSSDNCMQDMTINGAQVLDGGGNPFTMTPGTCISQYHYFQIGGANADFHATTDPTYFAHVVFTPGINTIEFRINNLTQWQRPNPTGLIVELHGEGIADIAVPEASTAGLLAAGLAAMALFKRRRSSLSC